MNRPEHTNREQINIKNSYYLTQIQNTMQCYQAPTQNQLQNPLVYRWNQTQPQVQNHGRSFIGQNPQVLSQSYLPNLPTHLQGQQVSTGS